MERRFAKGAVSVVEGRDDQPPKIVGLAAVYYDGTPDTEFSLWDGAVERIMPGAFDRAVSEGDDVLALFNHDPNQLLGRRSAGTLALKADKKRRSGDEDDGKRGLRYKISLGDTTVARDVLEHIRRGDLQGSSFAFTVTDQAWNTEDEVDIREIRGVRLFDVSPVTYPAYAATTTGVRDAQHAATVDEASTSFRAWKDTEAAEEAVRLRANRECVRRQAAVRTT